MNAESREDTAVAASCAPEDGVVDADGTVRRTTPCVCLPESDTVASWPACASCGLPQAPGKEFCGFCGRRWASAG